MDAGSLCSWNLSDGPGVRTQCFHCHGLSSIPGWGTKILQAAWCDLKEKKNRDSNIARKKITVKSLIN